MIRFSIFRARSHDFRRKLVDNFSRVLERNLVRRLFLVVLLANILSWVLAFFFYRRLDDALAVLHYNIDFGIDLVGEPFRLLALPAFLSIISLADFIFLLVFSRKQSFRFVATFIAGSLTLICFLVFLAYIALYLINF